MTGIKTIKATRHLWALLLAMHLALIGRAEDSTNSVASTERLGTIVEFTLRAGTNRPISSATAKALGLGEEKLPAIQVGFLPPGETHICAFGVSLHNTNDLFVALIDKETRSGKVWLTSPTGEIRATILTSSNSAPQVVSNDLHANEFVEQIGIWLELSAPVATNSSPLSGDSESFGEDRPDASGTVREISDKFGHDELQKLHQLLNSAEFQSRLTNYNCGDPVPRLMFSTRLRPAGFATTRAVEIYHSPGLSPSGRTRCLLFGVDYLLDKAVARLDPDPKQEDTREPHCDCSKRDSKEEWVTFPGPTEILAHAKVAAKNAARKADEAEEEKMKNLSVVHLDPAGVLVEPDASEHLVSREKLLGKLPPETDMELFAIDPGFKHWAYVIKRGGKQLVVLDGEEGKEYDEIPGHQRLEFSADGKHFAYIAKRAGKMMVVVDSKEEKAYDGIEEMFHPIFSPDGQHLAYIASKPVLGFLPPKIFAVVDGQEQKSYELVEAIQFSPDSKHLAYDADKKWNRESVVVLDGKESKTYSGLSGKAFSLDGNQLAFIAHRRSDKNPESTGTDLVVVNGKEGKPYQSISFLLRFSPDSKHLAYLAGKGSSGMKLLVRDDVETKYAHLDLGPFSPDSQHLACVGLFETNWLVLIDGKKLEPQVHLASKERGFSPVSDLTFSPDSRHLVYVSRGTEANWLVVLDGKAVKDYEGIAVSPVFSPDSKRLAYVVKRGGKSIPIFGGQEGKEYDKILTWRSALEDGAQTKGLDFGEKGVLQTMAIRGREILRLEIEFVKK